MRCYVKQSGGPYACTLDPELGKEASNVILIGHLKPISELSSQWI